MVRRRNSDLQPACAAPRRELTGGECLGCRAAAVCVDPPDRRLNLLLLAPPLQCILRTGADAAITHAAHDHAAVSKAADGGGRRRGGSCRKTRSIHAPEKPKYYNLGAARPKYYWFGVQGSAPDPPSSNSESNPTTITFSYAGERRVFTLWGIGTPSCEVKRAHRTRRSATYKGPTFFLACGGQ